MINNRTEEGSATAPLHSSVDEKIRYVLITSQFIRDLIDLLMEDDKGQEELIWAQLDAAVISKTEYTGVGVFFYFSFLQIENIRPLKDLGVVNWSGVVIRSPLLSGGAEAILHFKNGRIDNLEIWSFTGDYPRKELSEFTATQEWHGSLGRSIKRP